MTFRTLITVTSLLAASFAPAFGEISAPVLRANVVVSGDVVRIGDVVDNAGAARDIAIYRAPDLGTTGTLPASQILDTLRHHQVIGVDSGDIRDVSITRSARTLPRKEIEAAITRALAHRMGLGEGADLALAFDRELDTIQLDPANHGQMKTAAVRYDAHNSRFDVMFEIASERTATPLRLRFSGTAVEMIEAVTLTRALERGDVVKASDVVVERRRRAEVGADPVSRNQAVGMQARRSVRAGAALHLADLSKADLVQRGQSVTLVFENAGIYLTIRGKAMDSGTEGDSVTVLNLQSKREVVGTVTAAGTVSVAAQPRRQVPAAQAQAPTRPRAARTALLIAE